MLQAAFRHARNVFIAVKYDLLFEDSKNGPPLDPSDALQLMPTTSWLSMTVTWRLMGESQYHGWQLLEVHR